MDDSKEGDIAPNPHLENFKMFMPAEPKTGHSLYYNWGHQAILTYLMGKAAIKRLYPLITHTFVPILKLCADNRNDVEEAFKKIQGLNEKINFFDSPYEKYRKIYGNYVRGIEWCCVQLRKYFNKPAYDDLIIETTYSYNNQVMGNYADALNKMMLMGRTRKSVNKKPGNMETSINKIFTKILDFIFKYVFNPTFWMVGDVAFEEYNIRTGEMILEVPDCLMLRAPRMKQLPEESCLLF